MNECVIVLGPYRSGTSLTAQVIEKLGVDFGPRRALIATNRFNPGGYLERGDTNALNRRLIISSGRTLGDPGDAVTLMQTADHSILGAVTFPWPGHRPIWGLKDPRFCATLKLWVESGVLRADSIKILHVVRNPEAIVRSSLEHPSVQKFCQRDADVAKKMVLDYIALAEWQVRTLGLPTLRLVYEDLVHEPRAQTARIASWLEVDDPSLILRASRSVGKRSARRRYLLHRTLTFSFRAVRKAYRACTTGTRKASETAS
jgi:hypothetical protein